MGDKMLKRCIGAFILIWLLMMVGIVSLMTGSKKEQDAKDEVGASTILDLREQKGEGVPTFETSNRENADMSARVLNTLLRDDTFIHAFLSDRVGDASADITRLSVAEMLQYAFPVIEESGYKNSMEFVRKYINYRDLGFVNGEVYTVDKLSEDNMSFQYLKEDTLLAEIFVGAKNSYSIEDYPEKWQAEYKQVMKQKAENEKETSKE